MAFCPHSVDEWIQCPAVRLSALPAIQVGNWGLIERIVREEKQHKQMKTQNNIRGLFNIQQISHLSANNCQCPSWDCLCLPGQSRYDSLSLDCQILSLCSPRQAPIFIISCMSFFHRFLFLLLCILLLMIALFHFHFLKFPSVIWFFQPHLVIFFFFFKLVCLFCFLFSFLYARHHGGGWSNTTEQVKEKKGGHNE